MSISSHLFRRGKKSENWYYRFTYPIDVRYNVSRRYHKESTGTSDLEEARIKAAGWLETDLIIVATIRQLKLARANGTEDQFARKASEWAQLPGTTLDHDDGSWSYADEQEISTFGPDRKLIKREPNGTREMVRVSLEMKIPDDIRKLTERNRPRKTVSLDRRVLDLWIKVKAVKPAIQREADRALAKFAEACPGKNFSTASRTDGRALAAILFDEEELKSHTVRKMVGHLRAAVNVALDNPQEFPTIRLNPFAGVVTDRDDELHRKMFDDADMALVRDDLDNWGLEERLLWVLCATTGMRRSEAWHIEGEELISGYRVVRIGTKTESSHRAIPLPTSALPYLPNKISGRLFRDTPKNVGKRVIRNLRGLGITDSAKVLHSTRHRAYTRLHGVEDSVRDAILGHDDNGRGGKKRASVRYFGGHPVRTIADAMEMIGL